MITGLAWDSPFLHILQPQKGEKILFHKTFILSYFYLLLVKLVRGAYIVPEGEYARIGNYPSPVHDSYEDTSRSYNSIADWLLTNISTNQSSRSVRFILATVNKESVQKAVAR